MQEKYDLKHPINMGGKIIDSVNLRRLTLGDFYEFKDMSEMGAQEIGHLLGCMTGLQPPEVKKMDLEDVGFLSVKVEKAMESFQ